MWDYQRAQQDVSITDLARLDLHCLGLRRWVWMVIVGKWTCLTKGKTLYYYFGDFFIVLLITGHMKNLRVFSSHHSSMYLTITRKSGTPTFERGQCLYRSQYYQWTARLQQHFQDVELTLLTPFFLIILTLAHLLTLAIHLWATAHKSLLTQRRWYAWLTSLVDAHGLLLLTYLQTFNKRNRSTIWMFKINNASIIACIEFLSWKWLAVF